MIFAGLFGRYYSRGPKKNYSDFRVYYATAQRFIDKQDIYARPDESITPYKYSSMFALLVSPLAFVSIHAASLIFFAINFWLLVAVFIVIKRMIGRQKFSLWQQIALYALPALCASRFIIQVFDSGQVNILSLALVVFGFYLLYKGKDIPAAALLGLSVMIKYMPIIILPYLLARKKYKAACFMVVFIALYCMVPALYVGASMQIGYLKSWLPFISDTSFDKGSWYDPENQSLYSMAIRYLSFDYPGSIAFAKLTFGPCIAIGAALAAALYVLILLPSRREQTPPVVDVSLLLLCLALFNPNAWNHNFVMMIAGYMVVAGYLISVRFKDIPVLVLTVASFALSSWVKKGIVGRELDMFFAKASVVTLGALVLMCILFYLKFSNKMSVAQSPARAPGTKE